MHLVDDVHLETTAGWGVLGVIQHLAHIVDAGIGSGIELDQINETAAINFLAGAAFPARSGGDAGQTIQRLGKDTRNGGLADSSGAGE